MPLEVWKFLAIFSLGLWIVTILHNYRPDLKEKKSKSKAHPEDLGKVIGIDE